MVTWAHLVLGRVKVCDRRVCPERTGKWPLICVRATPTGERLDRAALRRPGVLSGRSLSWCRVAAPVSAPIQGLTAAGPERVSAEIRREALRERPRPASAASRGRRVPGSWPRHLHSQLWPASLSHSSVSDTTSPASPSAACGGPCDDPGPTGQSRALSRLQGGTALIPSAPSLSLCVEVDRSTRPGGWGVATSGRSADHSHPAVPGVLLSHRWAV